MTMKRKYKPFDRVLARRPSILDNLVPWKADIFSHIDEDGFYITIGLGCITDENILPFEGNEHLLGTTDDPEEEIELGDEYMFGITYDKDFKPDLDGEIVLGKVKRLATIAKREYFDFDDFVKTYAIRFKDFNPNDMEETRKHILCVKDGKVVRYKE